MNRSAFGRNIVLTLAVLALITGIIALPYKFAASAAGNGGSGLFPRTTSHEPDLPYYDIRSDADATGFLAQARAGTATDAARVADIRDRFVRGEVSLRARVPKLKVEYNQDIHTPEVIATGVWSDRFEYLTERSGGSRASVLRSFIEQNNDLIGVTDPQAAGIRVTADYTNPNGGLSFAHLEQFINDIPVFRGEIKAGFGKDGRMFRVINNLAAGLDEGRLSTEFGDASAALRAAAGHINYQFKPAETAIDREQSTGKKVYFGEGDFAPAAEKFYFPTEPGVARAAWRVFIDKGVAAYYVIVDAETGTMLWRKNLVNDQTQTATYNVYGNPNSPMDVSENPNPITPGPTSPSGVQGLQIARVNRTLIGNEGPLSFNDLGWITDSTGPSGCPTCGWTDGNAVEAGLNIVAPD
ncbi:MAG: hypothetical protein KBD94_09145, partial [Pyrinomonadaceae bacterium]|nr:hypothetical protein [Pyrinomonadaceae bacterium]